MFTTKLNVLNADVQYKNMLNEIVTFGTDTNDGIVRPKWDDGTPAYTRKLFSAVCHYDLRKEFPLLTCRRIFWKSADDERQWIYVKKSNKISELKSKIWDQWATPNSKGELTIGKSYGWQIANKFREVKTTLAKIKSINPSYNLIPLEYEGKESLMKMDEVCTYKLDQMDYVLHELKYNPYSRRIIIELYDIDDLKDMNLDPCCHELIFNVTKDEDGNKVVNLQLNQRSLDTVVAGGWDVFVHAMLLKMIAQTVGYIAGEFVHNITDAHIYNRHIEIAKAIIDAETYPAPTVELNPNVTDFYKFTTDDIIVTNYQYNKEITELCKNLPVAI